MNIHNTRRVLIEYVESFLGSSERLQQVQSTVDEKNQMARMSFPDFIQCDFARITEALRIYKKVVEREKIKCVFVGRAGNGKSAVINALLGTNVLKSNTGITTGCFINIQGCKEEEGYILNENGDREGYALLDRTDRTSENRFSVDTIVQLFYPESRCPLLANQIELMDCPGFDAEEHYEELIDRYCEDADIFVLVLDCNSGLNLSERKFFKKLQKKSPKVNVIVLINKWDEMNSEEEIRTNQVRLDIENSVSNFLKNISNPHFMSMYFSSATQALNEKDTSLQTFKQKLLKISANSFRLKMGLRIKSIKNDISLIKNLKSTKEMKIRKDIPFDKVDDLLKRHFNEIDSQLKFKIDNQTTKMLKGLQDSVDNDRAIDEQVLIFEDKFPKELAELFYQNHTSLLRKIEDLLKYHRIHLDPKTFQNNFVCYDDGKQMEMNYRNEMMLQCRGLTMRMRSSLLENVIDDNLGYIWGVIYWTFGWTNKQKQFKKILNTLRDFYNGESKSYLDRLTQLFRDHRNQAVDIRLVFKEEKEKMSQTTDKLLDLITD